MNFGFSTPSTPSTNNPSGANDATPRFAGLGDSFKAFGSTLKAQTDKIAQSAAQSELFGTPAPFGTPAAGSSNPNAIAAQPRGPLNPDDVPKEELVQLCTKMSKKIKTLQAQKVNMKEIIQTLAEERTEYLSFFENEVVMEVSRAGREPLS